MDSKALNNNIYLLSFQRNVAITSFALMLICNLLLVIGIVSKDKTTIIVPAHLRKEVELTQNELSRSYIEEMTGFFLSYLLDLTPSNVQYKSDVILKHIDPDYFQHMFSYFSTEVKKHEEYNLATSFAVSALEIEGMNVKVSGVMSSYYGKSGYKQEKVSYSLDYSYKGGVLLIKKFEKLLEE